MTRDKAAQDIKPEVASICDAFYEGYEAMFLGSAGKNPHIPWSDEWYGWAYGVRTFQCTRPASQSTGKAP